MSRWAVRFADVDIAAISQRTEGRDRQAMLWYTMRTLDKRGQGRIDEQMRKKACDYLGLNDRQAARIIAGGKGAFWIEAKDNVFYLRSLAKTAEVLKVRSFRAAFRAPLADFRGPLFVMRARMALKAVAAIRRGLPISNAAIAAMLGVSPRTVGYWKPVAGMRSIPNILLVAPLGRDVSVADVWRLTKEQGLRAVRYRGCTWLVQQMPSSFPLIRNGRGVRRRRQRANQGLRRTCRMTSGKPDGGNFRLYPPETYRAGVEPPPAVYTPAGQIGKGGEDLVRLWRRVVR